MGLPVRFVQGDAINIRKTVPDETYDFILDYSLLHHITSEDLVAYAKQFKELLKEGGRLLMVCYSDKDGFAEGKNRATGKYGNDMYYRTRQEIENLYVGLQVVDYREARLGKRAHHFAHRFLFTKT